MGHIHLIDVFIQTLGGLHKYLLILVCLPVMLFLVDILPVDDHSHGLVEGQNKNARYDAQPVIILAVLGDHEFIAQAAHALAVGPQNPVRRKGGQIAPAVLLPELRGRDMPQASPKGVSPEMPSRSK